MNPDVKAAICSEKMKPRVKAVSFWLTINDYNFAKDMAEECGISVAEYFRRLHTFAMNGGMQNDNLPCPDPEGCKHFKAEQRLEAENKLLKGEKE